MNFILITIELFFFGFAYALLQGNKQMNWFIRSIWGGVFFAFFYITFPILIFLDKKH